MLAFEGVISEDLCSIASLGKKAHEGVSRLPIFINGHSRVGDDVRPSLRVVWPTSGWSNNFPTGRQVGLGFAIEGDVDTPGHTHLDTPVKNRR